jgi:hypothetical protein
MGDEVREYEYRPKWTMIVFCGAFFALCTAVIASKAANNDRGVVINHIIELGPEGATTFYWGLAALCAAFVVIAVFLAYHRVVFKQSLLFGPAVLIVPASQWSRAQKEIAYRDIHKLSERSVYGQRFLIIACAGGKYTVNASMLPSKSAFEEVRELLNTKIRESQTAPQRQAESLTAHNPPRDAGP